VQDDTFFVFGALATLFVTLAFILTLRQMFRNHLAEKEEQLLKEQQAVEIAESNSGL